MFASTSPTTLGFTSDDGSTTLVAQAARGDADLYTNASGDFITFTFIGTGLDIIEGFNGTPGTTYSILVDGTTVSSGTTFFASIANRKTKVVSGLPYGTHTVRFSRTSAGSTGTIRSFVVYQPKKPTIPSGAVELADYNVMANYVGKTSASDSFISTGVLRKAATRECVYVGSWSLTLNQGFPNGFNVFTSTNNDSVRYTFFGTGVEILAATSAGTSTASVNIDGATYTGAATVSGAGSYSAGNWTVATGAGNSLQITGLTLGVHTIIVTVTANAANTFNFNGFDIITPIYSTKSNIFADIQNTLSVGSNSISDSRKITPVKDSGVQIKSISRAVGISISPTTTSTAYTPCPDLSATIRSTNGGKFKVNAMINWRHNATNGYGIFTVFIDGVQVGIDTLTQTYTATADMMSYVNETINVGPGVHKVDIYWRTVSGTLNCQSLNRNMTVEES